MSADIERFPMTHALARFASTTTYDQLPPEVVAVMKRITLDAFGTALAGTTLGEGVEPVHAVAMGAGGIGEASIIGFGGKAPVLHAAFVNDGSMHALNYDALGAEGGHFGVNAVPSPLVPAKWPD